MLVYQRVYTAKCKVQTPKSELATRVTIADDPICSVCAPTVNARNPVPIFRIFQSEASCVG